MGAITMPDVFLQHALVPLLVPMCGGQGSQMITRWSCCTLYLLLMAFARPVPAGLSDAVEAAKAHKNFEGVLQQFVLTCQMGAPEKNLGGIRVLMDVLWKLFTRRKKFFNSEEHLKSINPEVSHVTMADNFYHIPFVVSVLKVLTDLCVGGANEAVPLVQNLIAKELLVTNEAAAARRRPEPECDENHWRKHIITVESHIKKIKGERGEKDSRRGLSKLFLMKDQFVLLTLGTQAFFDPFDAELEEAEGVKLPRVLWNQNRVQPPRYACGQHGDDVTQHYADNIALERFLYFAIVNLMAHICADRNTDTAKLLAQYVPESTVKSQLVHYETLSNAGLRFAPKGILLDNALEHSDVEARDLGDISDLAALSAHTSLLLYAYLGQPPFNDEDSRSTIIKSVYLDGSRADDDDTVFEEAGAKLALQVHSLQGLCHMCSWQLASLADLCENMCSFNGKALPKPPRYFTDSLAALVSALSRMLSKLIGLGYFERFRRDLQAAGHLKGDLANVYKINHLVNMFLKMHALQKTHKGLDSTLFLAGLTDVCRVIYQCCSLSVNENIEQFMCGLAEFLPADLRRLVVSNGRRWKEIDVDVDVDAKEITSYEAEQSEFVEKVMSDLGKSSLPWEDEEVGNYEAQWKLSEFVAVLLDFVSLPDAALSIQAVRLLARLCRRRKDFLEAIDDLELLDVGDALKFNYMESWVLEADRVIDRINQVERNVNVDWSYTQLEGLEHYAHQFDRNDWNEDDVLRSKYVDLKDKAERIVEYMDKQNNHQIVCRMASANLQGDPRIVNFDFEIKGLAKREASADESGEGAPVDEDADIDRPAPLFIGAISPKWTAPREDGDDVKADRFRVPSEFSGCDELGRLYIRGQVVSDRFGGFARLSCVGLEIDYSEVSPKMYMYVDGYRVACIDRELEEGLVPCAVFGNLGQVVKLNQGRPRRGKGLVVSPSDTKIDENSHIVDIMYDVMKDNFYVKNNSEGEEHALMYNGWNSCFGTSSNDPSSEYTTKLKAFKMPVEPRRASMWCIDVSLTQTFIQAATFVRGAHVAQQKAFNSFFTNASGHDTRMVAAKWKPLFKEDEDGRKVDTGLVYVDIGGTMLYGATMIYVCFNEEDTSQLSPDQDAEITLKLRLTPLYPIRKEKAQLMKLLGHFSAICKQGEGHLLKYHKVELLALRVIGFLRSSDPLRDSIMSDKTILRQDSAFDVAVRFLISFVEMQPMYRSLFLRNDVFKFLVDALQFEDMGISQLLVAIFRNNEDATTQVTPSFVHDMMQVLKENLSPRPMVSLDALKVLIAMVTVDTDSIGNRDNGNIIATEFLKENTVLRLENPFIAMSRDGFASMKINFKENKDRIKEYLESMEERDGKREDLLRGGIGPPDSHKASKSSRSKGETAGMGTGATGEDAKGGESAAVDAIGSDPDDDDEDGDPLAEVKLPQLGSAEMFVTSFALASIELMLKCCAFGINRTVLRHFACEIIQSQKPADDGDGEGDEEGEQEEGEQLEGLARQRYFRHVVYWLATDVEQELPVMVQDAYLRMVCVMLRPHEIEDILHDRWTARDQRIRRVPDKPTHIVLLLIQWFTQYMKRFPELHVFSPRISPVVEAIDARFAFDLSKFFVRDHVMLLLLQTLTAYNDQCTWKKWWNSNFLAEGPPPPEHQLGGPNDRPPGQEQVLNDFIFMVEHGVFEGQPAKTADDNDIGGGGGGGPAEDDVENQRPDILSSLFAVLFDQRDWTHREWAIDEEMCIVIQQVLALDLCYKYDRERGKDLQKKLAAATGMEIVEEEEVYVEEEMRDGDDAPSGSGSGSGTHFSRGTRRSDGEYSELWRVTAAKVGRHAKITDEEREANSAHAAAFRPLIGMDNDDQNLEFDEPDPVLPRGLRTPVVGKQGAEEDEFKDFMYELVQLDDSKLKESLRVDVNLWRRQQLTHHTFSLEGSSELTWDVEAALQESLSGLGLKLFHGDMVLQELYMEVHMQTDGQNIRDTLGTSISSGEHIPVPPSLSRKSRESAERSKGLTQDLASNQVYFEIEVNGSDIIFLENLTFASGRKKLSLQIVGARTITMRSRSLFNLPGITLTVANPRMMALTSPTNFDPEVVHKVIKVGTMKHRLSNEPGNSALEDQEADMDRDGLAQVTIETKVIRKVIHKMMPKYRDAVVDLIEEQCLGLPPLRRGLDRMALSRVLEAEHVDVVTMINKACSYVMLEILLNKLDMERDVGWELQLKQTYPTLMPVFEYLMEDAYDEFNDSEVPLILNSVPEEDQMETLRTWILRISHVVRVVAFNKQKRLVFQSSADAAKQKKTANGYQDKTNIFEALFDDTGAMLLARTCCAALLNILQEIFTPNEEVEELWAEWTVAQQSSGQFKKTFMVEKAYFFCPFSVPGDLKKKTRMRLLRFFEDAQSSPIDPISLVPEMLYHPDTSLRLEALKLSCSILADADINLQRAFQNFDAPLLNLQKALAHMFSDYSTRATHGATEVQMMDMLLRKLENLCEGHNPDLQMFVGEDLSIEDKDFSTLLAEYLEEAQDDDDDDDRHHHSQGPANLVEWLCILARQVLDKMEADQKWQASMEGCEERYSLLAQLFKTAAEIVQGPNRGNQHLLLESEILLDINQLWLRQRADEFTFRDLLQDNEDLFGPWMSLLSSMRRCEISVLRFLMSLLEEEPLDPEDPDYRTLAEAVIAHKGATIRRMVEELNPKIICDKVITHWNLSPEVHDPSFLIAPVQEAGEVIENDTAERIVRTKGERESEDYPLDEQETHCLEICFLCWAVFEGAQQTPEFSMRGLFERTIERKTSSPMIYTRQNWSTAKSKIYDSFNEAIGTMHDNKYLHFLFGRVEILRGQRLQKVFFLVPEPIRSLKGQSLIHDWQESCINEVDRSGQEAKMQDFSVRVWDEYIGFVNHQFMLSQKPFPLNSSGEVMAFSKSAICLLTILITSGVALTYDGSYSVDHKLGQYKVHYPEEWYVWTLMVLGLTHFVCGISLVLFHMLAYSQWQVDTGIDSWKEENPNDHQKLDGIFRPILMISLFFGDAGLVGNICLTGISFLGLHYDFLIYSIHLMYVCAQVETLGKVFEALYITFDQVAGTAVLGFCVQYCFLVIGFLTFSKGYGFADMDTSGCTNLLECLIAHLDYGFRSGPVWSGPELTWWKFAFDYLYNLVVILILAAIISGIIIDTFANMRADLQAKNDDQQNNCFMCGINRSMMEQKMVKFDFHVFQEHYMWSYARFLMYLEATKGAELNGPESWVKEKLLSADYTFYPIDRALSLDSDDAEDFSQRAVRFADMIPVRDLVIKCGDQAQQVLQLKREVKTGLKESRDSVNDLKYRVGVLSEICHKKIAEEQAKKAASNG
ncbi:unnamed protein product [Polarella glacialis]|uniref:RyR/IP3R Homology associated domain-containing protein n=1 Tax=Polarella glacialis TaxID=89957 RepID=A0A813LBH7_POLGL|nr:unnamed protein product [Polarella glacialis]